MTSDSKTAKATRYHVEIDTGLKQAQVRARQADGLVNQAVDDSFKSNRQIIKENALTYFNLIFLVLAILLVIVGSFRDLTFLPVIIANTVIGIVQEIRAKKVLDKLTVLHVTKVSVVREGQVKSIPVNQLVLDDIVILKTGDQIPADATVVEGQVSVNEALLTGESNEIVKKPDAELMSGSFVVSGKCYARLERVGNEAYIAKLTLQAKSMGDTEQSEMIRSLNKLIKWVGIIIIPVGVLLFGQSMFLNHVSFRGSIVAMEAAVIGMIPEGLYLLTTLALALSAVRLARNQVMLHDMKSVETLARVNVLCLDKTGTITENEMAVQKVIPSSRYDEQQIPSLSHLIGDFAAAMPGDNMTMKAMKAHFTTNNGVTPIDTVPFSSVQKFSGAVLPSGSFVLGAPEFVLRDQFDLYQSEFAQYTRQGYRTLVFGQYQGQLSGPSLQAPVVPLGYILIANPVRKKAKKTFAYFAEQDVNLKVISGDSPETVAHVAAQAGIKHADQYVDASQLAEKDYADAVRRYTVFGRVKPDQKKKFIHLLKTQGNTVAMTGDGVNDILAMKEADCSIAMASGNSAAMQAAQVVLLDSDFARMPAVVSEGRRVVNNIERSASLFLVKNIFSFLMALFAMIMTVTYPLQPSQITLISAFTIGLPSFLLALENNNRRIRGKFLGNVMSRAIPGGVTSMLTVSALVICDTVLHLRNADLSTAATMLLVAVGLMVLAHISAPLNKFRAGVMALSFTGILVSIIFLNKLFSISRVSKTSLFLLVILFFAAEAIFRYLSNFADGLHEVLIQEKLTDWHLSPKEIQHAYQVGKSGHTVVATTKQANQL